MSLNYDYTDAANHSNFRAAVKSAVEVIQASLVRLPRFIIVILAALYEKTEEKFPEHGTTAVAGMFVLRQLMSTLSMPEAAGLGIEVPPPLKDVPKELSKVLQFVYSRAEVQLEQLLPLAPFIHQQAQTASRALCQEIIQIAKEPLAPSKLFKGLGSSKEVRNIAKAKLQESLLDSASALEDEILQCLSASSLGFEQE